MFSIRTNIGGKMQVITIDADYFEKKLQELGLKIKDFKIETSEGIEITEKAVSKAQQRFMGMVHAAHKGEKPASSKVAKAASSMGKKDAEDFAATKHKGLPEKVAEEDTEINKNNWTGEKSTIKVNEKTQEVEVPNIGTFKLTFTDDPEFNMVNAKVTLDGEETDLQGFKYGKENIWTFGNHNFEYTRENKNPYVALAQLAHNLY